MIVLRGQPLKVSREQVRAFLHASVCVLGYHNLTPCRDPLSVHIRRRLADNNMGTHRQGFIVLRADLGAEDMLTTCLHEVIHACVRFPEGHVEKLTTKLCARIKRDVSMIAHLLLQGTYQRAAFLAHTKLSYRDGRPDYYDTAEDEPVGVKTKYTRRRP